MSPATGSASPEANRQLRLRRPDLVLADPYQRVLDFFSSDASSRGPGSYDQYVLEGLSPPNRIVVEDIEAINRTMRARAPHGDWKGVFTKQELPELVAVSPDWDLFLMPDEIWREERVPERLAALFSAVLGKGIGISRATKVLHIKRPALVPVCDAYVLELMGIPGSTGDSAVSLIHHLRDLRADLNTELLDLQRLLA
ncbi:MAG: DUF6308 family protein, partial [Candidatus Dormiibacterota bacterium]